jgi:hypothetical protein
MTIDNTGEMRRRPTHPGELLREDFLPDYGLTVAGLADSLPAGAASAPPTAACRGSSSSSAAPTQIELKPITLWAEHRASVASLRC